MKSLIKNAYLFIVAMLITLCQSKKDVAQLRAELESMDLNRGEIALCGTGDFGEVDFALSCEESVRADFNLATSLLHSFEYGEAEKVFAKVIDRDPQCLMAYWGAAMSNFHPLWAPPTQDELTKGSKTIAIARTLEGEPREKTYLEAIAAMFDNWETLDHKARLGNFLKASEVVYVKYPNDKEAAIFYSLALRATADPADKTFEKQKKAGEILAKLFEQNPDHPGIAHYLIHTYDFPELAELALPAARKYASIAAASAHAQHMPSHIFTRLGLWEEAIQSNLNSTDAARCYAEKLGKEGHWDQELHGTDYLVYAYLQQANDDKAKEQMDYLRTVETVFPVTFVDAYSFAAVPVRYAVERKDWKLAASLELHPANFPWEKFLWEKAIHHFGKSLGMIHGGDVKSAAREIAELKAIQSMLVQNKKDYEANQVMIQIKSAEAWFDFKQGKKDSALGSMIAAAELEDKTEKHSVTPGEVAPARELLGDMYIARGEFGKAKEAYEANLKNRPNRFNSVYGAALAAKKSGNNADATKYFNKLLELTKSSAASRPELKEAREFLRVSI